MMVHRHFLLLALDFGRDGEIDSISQRGKAELAVVLECISGVLSDHANSVSTGLSETGTVVVAEVANRLHDALEVFG